MNSFPILSLVIFLPLLGALAISFCKAVKPAKIIAITMASLELIASLSAVQRFQASDSGFQLVEKYAWISPLNIEFLVGVDGISVLFLPMTALLTLVTIIATWNSAQPLPRLHFALLLALETATIGVFCALDMVLFFLFWQLTLPSLFLLISLWGIGPKRRGAAIKFMLYMLFSSVPLLFAIMLLAINHALQINDNILHGLAFSFPILLETVLPEHLQKLVFFLLLVSFAVKAPLVPLHTWLPTSAMEGSTQVNALLIGLNLGVYGIVRFAMTLAPSAAVEYSWLLGLLGAIALIYGALITIQQSNLRRLLAYASISQIGLVMIGIAALNMQGIQGAILQMLNFTLIAYSLMLMAGFIQHRSGTTEQRHLGGLIKVAPRLTGFYLLLIVAAMGIPGTSGFPAELLLVLGALLGHPSLGVTTLAGLIILAVALLNFSRRAFLGPITLPTVKQLQDLRPRELCVLCIPLVLILALGFFPNTALKINQAAAEEWLSRLLDQPKMEGDELASLTVIP